MSRYDGLIIPRSYSEYINKTDAATLSQALQLSGVMDAAPTANSNHPIKSGGVYTDTKNIRDIISEYFSPTATYKVGDYVLYNNTLYRCTVNHSGAWNGAHFSSITIGEALESTSRARYAVSQEVSLNDGLIDAVITAIQNTSNYQPFQGATQSGQEGAYWGYRHSSFAEGLIITKYKILMFYAEISSSVATMATLRTIMNVVYL